MLSILEKLFNYGLKMYLQTVFNHELIFVNPSEIVFWKTSYLLDHTSILMYSHTIFKYSLFIEICVRFNKRHMTTVFDFLEFIRK